MLVRTEGFNALSAKYRPDGVTKRIVKEITQTLFETVVEKVSQHTKTGKLERSIAHTVKGLRGQVSQGDQSTMVNGKNYGIFVHFGTKPHIIKPKNKKTLRFVSAGGFVFSKVVHHPGYRGDPFMDHAKEEVNRKANSMIERIVDEYDI